MPEVYITVHSVEDYRDYSSSFEAICGQSIVLSDSALIRISKNDRWVHISPDNDKAIVDTLVKELKLGQASDFYLDGVTEHAMYLASSSDDVSFYCELTVSGAD
ncbi:hypothetical protein [Vibrio agarivorans]|uniref:Uncharacterized protein n=1 Tax=Vibrio agarivorans TaxID=153622 RepID=A0ABT7Y7G5_9VIBR|nr:hypothetical protein [Vibrio agarivorans]MDN2483931.1 hypothetical protein [Vibrio agarivorans]